jgi:hypothetical protein
MPTFSRLSTDPTGTPEEQRALDIINTYADLLSGDGFEVGDLDSATDDYVYTYEFFEAEHAGDELRAGVKFFWGNDFLITGVSIEFTYEPLSGTPCSHGLELSFSPEYPPDPRRIVPFLRTIKSL